MTARFETPLGISLDTLYVSNHLEMLRLVQNGQNYPPQMYGGGQGGPSPLTGGQMQNGGPMGQGGHQQQMGQQHQQQQGMQGMQAGGQGGGPPTASDGQSNAAGPAPEMNLANVLHYLQSEWRHWERDRNEWEIERAEMRVRVEV